MLLFRMLAKSDTYIVNADISIDSNIYPNHFPVFISLSNTEHAETMNVY